MLGALEKKMATNGLDLLGFARELVQGWSDGSIKLYVIFKSLNYREENHRVFLDGAYIPLVSDGDRKHHVCAFVRKKEGKIVMVIVPRFVTHFIKSTDQYPLGRELWGSSSIVIPEEIPDDEFRNIFTGETASVVQRNDQRVLIVGEVFANFPVAMLEAI